MIFYSQDSRVLLDTEVDDNSYRHRAIMGDHNITLHYSLAEHVELPVGAYCLFEGQRYTLERPEAFTMKHSRNFEYTVTMESVEAKAKIYKFRNPVDGRLKFTLTAKPKEHLQMFVDNMNRRDTGWTVGDCVEGTEVMISYNHNYCTDALSMMASEFDTEYEIVGKRVSLKKIEYNKNNPLALSYGHGNGFRSGVGRSNTSDKQPVEILFVQGGSENIDLSKYGSSELHLPKNQTIQYDGEYFETDSQFNPAHARTYVVDDKGLSIRRADKQLTTGVEDSLDASDIYPKREGRVTSVVVVNAEKNFYDIVDSTIPNTLDFNECLIEGNKLTVIFQSGMLVTRKFEVTYFHTAADGKLGKRFELVPIEEDGMMMPSGNFIPVGGNDGDRYAVFNCQLPDSYICDNATKTGAEWDMFKTAVRYMYENEDVKYTFKGELDGIWAKKSWENIGAMIKLGGFIDFSDVHFQQSSVLVRIVGIKDYINNPRSPELELSNSTVTGGFSSTLNELKGQEVVSEEYHRDSIQFTKRRFRDAQETISMLEDALLTNFTESINPLSVQTMSMLVGDESLQYRFVDSKTNPTTVPCNIAYNQETKQLVCAAGIMQHLTLGIKNISPQHSASEYKYWDVALYNSAAIDDATKKYYLYIKASRTTSAATYILSEKAIGMNDNGSYFHFLVGVLNSEYDNERSFVTLYGFTEVLPGRITTDRLVSSEGTSYFDMLNNAMKLGTALDFNSQGDGKLRIKGTIVQSQSGDESPVGVYRGMYNASYTYYNGDEVAFTQNGLTSTYRFIYATPTKGIDPTNTIHWQVRAAGVKGDDGVKGEKGDDGLDGISPNTAYKSTVFKRSNTAPTTPTGGSYANPVPTGWSDGVPTGKEKLWASTRIFSSDGLDPQQASWTTPRQMTDTADFDVEFSSVGNPSAPLGHPNTNSQWTNTASEATIWMATAVNKNGVWGAWQISRIKGEKGEDGTSIKIKGTVSSVSNLPTPPTDPSDCYIVGQNLYVWDGDSWVNTGQFKGEKGDDGLDGSDGVNAYVHIKYAKSLSVNDWSDNNGETPNKYIGIYCDSLPTDSMTWNKYSWSKWKGDDGFGYEYIYRRTTSNSAPSTPTTTSQNDDYVPSSWTDNPSGVNATYKYEWLCYRKKVGGVWGKFIGSAENTAVAALWAKYGADGANGSDGADAPYYEIRYAKNGSTTSAPSLSTTSVNPSGWSLIVPTAGTAEYVWMTSAMKNGAGTALVQKWSAPIRITPYNGKDGADGADGKSPAMVYRGVYDSGKTYYGNANRIDCVKSGNSYYIARIDAGTFSNVAPPDTGKWNDFGASFESVATNLLLADNANIAGWVFRNNRLESENGNVYLDGTTGEVRLAGTIQLSTGWTGDYSDVNVMYLPPITFHKYINLGCDIEDIGKVIRFYNSSKFSGGHYLVWFYDFTAYEAGGGSSKLSSAAALYPQEVVEMTCFERQAPSNGARYGRWEITSRFSQRDFYNDEAKGRYPIMKAIGHVYGTNAATASISGYFYDGRSLGSLFTVSRIGKGQYRVSFKSGLLGSNYWVIPWGYGYIREGSNMVNASIRERNSDNFIIDTGDDDTRNDANFEFMILGDYWYYNLTD